MKLWVEFTSEAFLYNYTWVENDKLGKSEGLDGEFKSPNMKFVHLIVRQMYPDMRPSMIKTYISKNQKESSIKQ